MEIWFFIIGFPLGFFALLYFGYKDDYQRDKHEFKGTVIGVLITFFTIFLTNKFNLATGFIFGILGAYLHSFWREDYESKKEE